jgi:hypothetical protein
MRRNWQANQSTLLNGVSLPGKTKQASSLQINSKFLCAPDALAVLEMMDNTN